MASKSKAKLLIGQIKLIQDSLESAQHEGLLEICPVLMRLVWAF
jgi:hypothetical protein